LLHWPRHKADFRVAPARRLQCRPLVAALRATRRSPQHVARRVRSPANDQRCKGHGRLVGAVGEARTPDPNPMRFPIDLGERWNGWLRARHHSVGRTLVCERPRRLGGRSGARPPKMVKSKRPAAKGGTHAAAIQRSCSATRSISLKPIRRLDSRTASPRFAACKKIEHCLARSRSCWRRIALRRMTGESNTSTTTAVAMSLCSPARQRKRGRASILVRSRAES
jgi:hypothetical protein